MSSSADGNGEGEGEGDAAGSDYELDYDYYQEMPGLGRTVELGDGRLTAERRTMTRDFECAGHAGDSTGYYSGRAPHGKRASSERPRLARVIVTKVRHDSPWERSSYDESESLHCEGCAKHWEAEEAARRAHNKRAADARKEETSKRHKATVGASGAAADCDAKLRTLKVGALKRLCQANELMVSGTKDVLITRLVNAKMHGRAGRCPLCRNAKLDLGFAAERPAEPDRVECRHMRGAGARCGWARTIATENKRSVLHLSLVDSAARDLSKAGISP